MSFDSSISILVVTGGFYGELGTGHLKRSADFLLMLQREYPSCEITVAVNNNKAKQYLERWFEAFPGELLYWDQMPQRDQMFSRVLCDCLDYFDLSEVCFDNAIAVDSGVPVYKSNVSVFNYLIGDEASPLISHIPFPKFQATSCLSEPNRFFCVFGYFGGDINEIYLNRRKIFSCIVESLNPSQFCRAVVLFLPLEPNRAHRLKMLCFLRRALRLKDPAIIIHFDSDYDGFLGRTSDFCNDSELRWVSSPGLFGLNLIRSGADVRKFCLIHKHQRESESTLNLLKSGSGNSVIRTWINWLESFGEISFDEYFLGKQILWIKIDTSPDLLLHSSCRLRSLEDFFLPLYYAKYRIRTVVFEYLCSYEPEDLQCREQNCDVTGLWVDKLTFTALTEHSEVAVTTKTLEASALKEFPEELLQDIRKIETTDKIIMGANCPSDTPLLWFMKSIESENEEALIFSHGDNVVGICTILNLSQTTPRVGLFMVATPFRNQGFSGKCLDSLLDFLTRYGKKSVSITAIATNEIAVNAYSAHPKFECTRRERSYFYVR